MIHQIYSTLDSFKVLKFHEGLNIVRAVKSPGSTDKQTRNGAGKSSFIAIVNMLLGARLDGRSIFKHPALVEHQFGMDFDIRDDRVLVERSGKPRSTIQIKSDRFVRKNLERRGKDGYWSSSQQEWTEILGNVVFNLPTGEEYKSLGSFKPSFRSVFSYFAREHPAGFSTYEKHFAGSGKYQYQIPLSFILGIDWKISQELEQLRRTEKRISESKKAAETEDFLPSIGSPSELRTLIVTRERRYVELEQNLKQFRLLPEYREYEVEAMEITNQLGKLADQIMLDRRAVNDLQSSMELEQVPGFDRLEALYKEANVLLPESVTLRYGAVRDFHKRIVENRRLYLQGEVEQAQQRIRENLMLQEELQSRYTKILAILRPHGAVDQLIALERELRDLAGELATLRQRSDDAKAYERRKAEVQLNRAQLELQLQENLSEQSPDIDSAILAFEQVAHQLYETGGALFVRSTHDGPEFEVTMRGEKSKGITNMQTFAFDMMLAIVCVRRNISPGFLIHDSHLFDGVDTRQIKKALQVGADLAKEYGFQYIVTMNSDLEPNGFEKYRIDTELTDATEDGGLFGFRFD